MSEDINIKIKVDQEELEAAINKIDSAYDSVRGLAREFDQLSNRITEAFASVVDIGNVLDGISNSFRELSQGQNQPDVDGEGRGRDGEVNLGRELLKAQLDPSLEKLDKIIEILEATHDSLETGTAGGQSRRADDILASDTNIQNRFVGRFEATVIQPEAQASQEFLGIIRRVGDNFQSFLDETGQRINDSIQGMTENISSSRDECCDRMVEILTQIKIVNEEEKSILEQINQKNIGGGNISDVIDQFPEIQDQGMNIKETLGETIRDIMRNFDQEINRFRQELIEPIELGERGRFLTTKIRKKPTKLAEVFEEGIDIDPMKEGEGISEFKQRAEESIKQFITDLEDNFPKLQRATGSAFESLEKRINQVRDELSGQLGLEELGGEPSIPGDSGISEIGGSVQIGHNITFDFSSADFQRVIRQIFDDSFKEKNNEISAAIIEQLKRELGLG